MFGRASEKTKYGMWFRTGKCIQFLLRDYFIIGIRNGKGNWGWGVTKRELK